jgi:hypothetical protein
LLRYADDFRHDLRGRDDGAPFEVSLQRPRVMRLLSTRARMQARAQISKRGATRLPELGRGFQESRPPPRRAHRRRISVAKAQVQENCLLLWRILLRGSCGASSARSSICAYIALVAHRHVPEQSSPLAARVPGAIGWLLRPTPIDSRTDQIYSG